MSGGSRIVPGSGPAAAESSGHSRVRARLVEICERIASGTPQNHACALEGVPRSSFYALLDSDPEALLQVQAARANAAEAAREELRMVALGGGAPGSNANVLLHLLERAHPDEYAPPKQRVEQTGADGGPQQVEHSGAVTITLEDAKRIAREGGK